MPKTVLVVVPERGRVNPLIGVAQRLARLGHSLSVLSTVDLSERFARAGVSVDARVLPAPSPDPVPPPQGRALIERLRDPAWLHARMASALLDPAVAQSEAIERYLREASPDVVVADPRIYGAVFAAHRTHTPWAAVSSSLHPVTPDDWRVPVSDAARRLSPRRAEMFAAAGLPDARFKVCDARSPWLNTAFTTEAFVPRARAESRDTHLVGPSLPEGPRGDEPDFPFERLDPSRPVVLFSLGQRVCWHPSLFRAAAEALVPDGIQLVIAAHDLFDHEAFRRALPAEVIVARDLPQVSVLARAGALLSHGGASSVMEALAMGVPTCVVPIFSDHMVQARLLGEAGAGLMLEPERFTTAACREAVQTLLDPEHPMRARVAALRDAYRAHDGAENAARLIDRLARTQRPIAPPVA